MQVRRMDNQYGIYYTTVLHENSLCEVISSVTTQAGQAKLVLYICSVAVHDSYFQKCLEIMVCVLFSL